MSIPINLDELRIFIDSLKLLLSAIDIFRPHRDQPPDRQTQKKEETLGQAIQKAERDMTSPQVDAKEIAHDLEVSLETELGETGKDAVIARALGIVAITRPFEIKSFQYAEHLSQVLQAAHTFCEANNVFRLRGEPSDGEYILPLPRLGAAFRRLLKHESSYFDELFRERSVIGVSVSEVGALLKTGSEELFLVVCTTITKACMTGGTEDEISWFRFSLAPGSEVNRIGFNVKETPRHVFARDFDTRLSIDQLRELVFALFDDLTKLANELSQEEAAFDKEISPALTQILATLGKHS